MSEEFPEGGTVEGSREAKGDRGGRCDTAEEHQEVVGKGEEEVQTRESLVKNPPGETERLCLKARQQPWTSCQEG